MERTLLGLALLVCAGAAPPATEPVTGIRYTQETQADTAGLLHIVRIDLTNPRLSPCVTPAGADPDGAGHWQTTLLPIPQIAEREGFIVAINGDFFANESALGAGQDAGNLQALVKRGYWLGAPAAVMGSAVSDGKQWASSRTPHPGVLVHADGRVAIEDLAQAPPTVRQAVTGSAYLVKDGVAAQAGDSKRNARTAIGLDRDGRVMTIVVADGLVEGKTSGISIPDLAKAMLRLGCHNAINLDGGGSSTLVMRQGEGKYQVLNHPTDGKARPVANCFGIKEIGPLKQRESGK